jgi:3-oxoacyl-[acyl-carrier protein] reductase
MTTDPIFTFGGRTALVTGGTRNIGLAISEKFLHSGMKVAVIGKSKATAREADRRLKEFPGKYKVWSCDLTNEKQLGGTIESVVNHFGSIDILVNCAGMLETRDIQELDREVWDEVIELNLKASFFVTQKCLPYLMKGQHPRVINISSNAGRMGGYSSGTAYAASKGGMIAMTYNMARRFAEYRITVNAIAPGTIDSDMSKQLVSETKASFLTNFPLGRLGLSYEVAAAVCYFASIESGFTTGAVLDVNGGMFMG